jgi:DNA polymerase III, gamma/tau subunits
MFSSIIGHEAVKKKLEALVVGDSSGTYLFFGPPSVGKRTTAFELGKAILCLNKTENCQCRSCQNFYSGHPDFLCVGQHEKIKVENVDLVLDFTSLSSILSNKKVIVVDNAQDITWEAANRLLKVFEEPPPRVTFILVTPDPQALIPTILSRCIKYEFGTLSREDLTNIIWKKLGFDLPQAQVLGWLASESSMDVFSKAGHYLKYRNMAYEFLSGIKSRDVSDSIDYIDKVERSDIGIFADMLLLVLTDLLLLLNKIKAITNVDLAEPLEKLAQTFKDWALVGCVATFSQVKKNSYLNVNMNMILKNTIIKIHPLLIS